MSCLETPDREYNILIADDSESDAALNEREVRRVLAPCRFLTVDTRNVFCEALDRFAPDAILSDFKMPDFDGFTALRLTRQKSPATPVIIVTGSINEETAVRCLKAGAADYILKENLQRLGPALLDALKQRENRTRRYETQATLIENEKRFRRLAENASDIIYRYEFLPRRGFSYVSPAATKITGYSPEEHYADPDLWLKIVHPEDRNVFLSLLTERSTGHTPVSLRCIHKQGGIVWTEQRNARLQNRGGALVAIEGIVRDVTRRKRADEEIVSLARFSSENPFPVLRLSAEGNIMYANASARPLLDMWGVGIGGRVPPYWFELAAASLASGENKTVDARFQDKTYAISLAPVTGAGYVNLFGSDISERRRAEDALRRSEEHYRTFFENDPAGDFIASADGKIISCNRAFLNIVGLESSAEAAQLNFFKFCTKPEQRAELVRLINTRRLVERLHIDLERRDGREIHAVVNAYHDRGPRGEIDRIVGFLIDETTRRQLEEQLYQAKKLESIGTLAGGIAHDFNNILSIISGYLLLLDDPATDQKDVSRMVKIVQQTADRGVGLVKQLLTFARKTETRLEPVFLPELMNEIAKLVHETFPKTITLKLKTDSSLPVISADSTQMYQILLNLCLNARDAMPGGGTLSLACARTDGATLSEKFSRADHREYVTITVSDTGTGIDEAIQKRIFEPFFTTKEAGSGTGLGLALVYGIVEKHEGFIDFSSENGRGTTFVIHLPVREKHLPVRESAPPRIGDIQGKGETVLLIEDEALLRDLVQRTLEAKGYTVVTAADGEEGVEIFEHRRNEIDIIITDYGLPKLNGSGVFGKVRAIDPLCRVVLVSGFIDPQVKPALQSAGMKYFIQKPFRPEGLLKTLREALDAK